MHPLKARDRRTAGKVKSLPQLVSEVELRRRNGQKIAFTNGCFDVLHAGHVQYLNEARAQADALIVAVNSDSSVPPTERGRTAGQSRRSARGGAGRLAVRRLRNDLLRVDAAAIDRGRSPRCAGQRGRLSKKARSVGGDFVERLGGRVHLATLRDGYSTTNLIEKMKAA